MSKHETGIAIGTSSPARMRVLRNRATGTPSAIRGDQVKPFGIEKGRRALRATDPEAKHEATKEERMHQHPHEHSHAHEHEHADGTRHSHPHSHQHVHEHDHASGHEQEHTHQHDKIDAGKDHGHTH